MECGQQESIEENITRGVFIQGLEIDSRASDVESIDGEERRAGPIVVPSLAAPLWWGLRSSGSHKAPERFLKCSRGENANC